MVCKQLFSTDFRATRNCRKTGFFSHHLAARSTTGLRNDALRRPQSLPAEVQLIRDDQSPTPQIFATANVGLWPLAL
jgi:hypothetical protein